MNGSPPSNVEGMLEALFEKERQVDEIETDVHGLLYGIGQAAQMIKGTVVERHGKLWSICALHQHRGTVVCYGVRYYEGGRIGTRGYSLGRLSACKIWKEEKENA